MSDVGSAAQIKLSGSSGELGQEALVSFGGRRRNLIVAMAGSAVWALLVCVTALAYVLSRAKSSPCPPLVLGETAAIIERFTPPMLAPDGGARADYELTVSFWSVSELNEGLLRIYIADESAAHRARWPELDARSGFERALASEGSVESAPAGPIWVYTLRLTGRAPSLPGLYELRLDVVSVSGACASPVIALTAVADVSCSALVDNWCDGDMRWIPAKAACVRTYKPCGQESAVGVAETDLCRVYACEPVSRSCSLEPLGSGCATCTGVDSCEPVHPGCVNADGSPRLCGDDGCGVACGTGCPPATPFCSLAGACVAPIKGSCASPYPLLGSSMFAGDSRLYPGDPDGVLVYLPASSNEESSDPVVGPVVDTLVGAPAGAVLRSATALASVTDDVTIPEAGIRVRLIASVAPYVDSVTPFDGAASVRDLAFTFVIASPQPTAVEVYARAPADSTVLDRDTLLVLLDENCEPIAAVAPSDTLLSDDALPPGGLGSRVLASSLQPGRYTLVLTAYSDYGETGPGLTWLEAVFTADACVPACDDRECGSNGCGSVCNVQGCGLGLACANSKCSSCQSKQCPQDFACDCDGNPELAPLIPNGTSVALGAGDTFRRQCGADNGLCGSAFACGVCAVGSACDEQLGVCVAVTECDSHVPICTDPLPDETGQYFCGGLCRWIEINEPLGDILMNNEQQFLPGALFQWRPIDTLSCELATSVVGGTGMRLFLRFQVLTINQGTAAVVALDPHANPGLYVWSHCHKRYDVHGFTSFRLKRVGTDVSATGPGLRPGYCIQTGALVQTGPKVPCSSSFNCDGVDPGGVDIYTADIDGFWIDLRDLYDHGGLNRWMIFEVDTNRKRHIIEYSYSNNVRAFPIYVPCAPALVATISYPEFIAANPQVCCTRPDASGNIVGPDPITCPVPSQTYCANPPPMPVCESVIVA